MHKINVATEAFNSKQACELTAATARQLNYWDHKGLVKPSFSPASGRGSRRLYSYNDLLAIQTVMKLRNEKVSLQRIGKCVRYLRGHLPDVSQPLTFCRLITDGQTVYLVWDENTLIDTVKRQGQLALLLDIAAIDRELRDKALSLTAKRTEQVIVGDYAYQVEIQADTDCGGYVAEVAGLPGCITQGESLDEVLENVTDAIATYLQAVDDLAKRGVHLSVRGGKKRKARRA
ncbi:MAG: MerR family transcriptional regulator [Phycisphaerae bacterium]|nr:MerR family transcriptional regulator [Phycisphaerae bacterium]